MSHENAQEPSTAVRVLIVAASMDILGGQAVQAERLIRHLQNEPSVRVSFLAINPRLPGPLRVLQAIKYVRTVTTSMLYVLHLLLRVRKYDVIHVFSASYLSFLIAPTPAILVSKLYGKKIVLNYHSGEAEDHLRRWPRSTKPIINLVDEVVVPSEYLVRVFAKFGIDAYAIFNVVDLDKFEFRERTPLQPVFLSNRNLESHYGVDCVLRAFAYIQQRIPHAVLTVVGDGSQREALEQLARELDLRQISFLGRVEHEAIHGHYSAADIYLNASRIDNQPLSILEAFACGLPVVTTDAGGIPDIVTDGVTGSMVPVDDCNELATRALELLGNETGASAMVERARVECQRYTWPAVCGQWLSLYHSVGTKKLDYETERHIAEN
ncbi:MAG TPA: glycosyltransferase family 4 protein [Pyrinomonadaceae bacterium]|nr:glycosyltransferase family 4 protein [Pyrinomonadaceae bacterium]